MPGVVPRYPKIYHIVHVDRLESILNGGYLYAASEVNRMGLVGTTLGDENIKRTRSRKSLDHFPDLTVGDCVPFYFCPRSVLLYKNWMAGRGTSTGRSTPENRGGEDKVVHLVADLSAVVKRADANGVRWLFTNVNATMTIAQEFTDISQLHQLDWNAIHANDWRRKMDFKSAEFLVEKRFPMGLVEGIGVKLQSVKQRVELMLRQRGLSNPVAVEKRWYYGT